MNRRARANLKSRFNRDLIDQVLAALVASLRAGRAAVDHEDGEFHMEGNRGQLTPLRPVADAVAVAAITAFISQGRRFDPLQSETSS